MTVRGTDTSRRQKHIIEHKHMGRDISKDSQGIA
jgi:hypothetical protein